MFTELPEFLTLIMPEGGFFKTVVTKSLVRGHVMNLIFPLADVGINPTVYLPVSIQRSRPNDCAAVPE